MACSVTAATRASSVMAEPPARALCRSGGGAGGSTVTTRRSPHTILPRTRTRACSQHRGPATSRDRSMRSSHARASSRVRRATTVVTHASPSSPGGDGEGTPPPSPPPGASSSRRDVINGVFFALSVPLWRDVLHDLGYLHGEEDEPADLPSPPPGSGFKTATFAGGCFWCMEKPFDVVDGVIATTSGYTAG